MQITFSSKEFLASTVLTKTLVESIPMSNDKTREVKAQLEDLRYELKNLDKYSNADLEDGAIIASKVEALNSKHLYTDEISTIEFRAGHDGTYLYISWTFDEDKMVKIMEILTEEVDGLSGAFISLYGIFKMFGRSIKRIGERIEAVLS